MTMSIKFEHTTLGGHVHVDVWSSEFGPETTHGRNGRLVFRLGEWEAFREILDLFNGPIENADPDYGPIVQIVDMNTM